MRVFENGIYRDMTPEEEENFQRNRPDATELQIADLKQRLADTDYKAIKYAEGMISAEDYSETKAQRQAWRDEINRLQGAGRMGGTGVDGAGDRRGR